MLIKSLSVLIFQCFFRPLPYWNFFIWHHSYKVVSNTVCELGIFPLESLSVLWKTTGYWKTTDETTVESTYDTKLFSEPVNLPVCSRTKEVRLRWHCSVNGLTWLHSVGRITQITPQIEISFVFLRLWQGEKNRPRNYLSLLISVEDGPCTRFKCTFHGTCVVKNNRPECECPSCSAQYEPVSNFNQKFFLEWLRCWFCQGFKHTHYYAFCFVLT